MKTLFTLPALALVLFSSCASLSSTDLLGDWTATQLAGNPLSEAAQTPRLTFEGAQLSGFNGCNRIFGAYTLQKGRPDFSRLASTQMACLPGNPDTAFMEALRNTTRLQRKGDSLYFRDAAGTTLLTMAKDK